MYKSEYIRSGYIVNLNNSNTRHKIGSVMQMIFAFLFLLGLNPVFSQTAAATVVGNNWDATKHCFLQTGKTDCLSLFREGGCQADYCGKDEIYGYGTYQLPAFQVPKTTKCIVAKDCDETQMTLNFGNIDRYKNYWCMEQGKYIYIYIYI